MEPKLPAELHPGIRDLLDRVASEEIHPNDLSRKQIDEVRTLLSEDLFLFAWVIFGYTDLEPSLHGDISHLLGEVWGTPGNERLLIQIPREFFKTSMCTKANSLWQVCRKFYKGEDEALVIFNERLENTQKWVRSIRDVVMNSRLFHAVYRELLPPGVATGDTRSIPKWWKWSDTELLFQRNTVGLSEASITGSGIEAATTGGHWPTILIDDPISLKHMQSQPEMERAREWVDRHTYLMRPVEKGRSLVVDTPWTHNDVNVDFIQRYGYAVYRRSGLEDAQGRPDINGESIFPKKLTTVELRKMHDRDPFGFWSQIQCLPRAGKDTQVEASWLRYGSVSFDGEEWWFHIRPEFYDRKITAVELDVDVVPPPSVRLSHLSKMLLFDPAPSRDSEVKKEPYAGNGLVMEGVDAYARRFVLESLNIRTDPISVMETAFQMLERWGCDTIAIEEVNFSILYQPFMRYMTKVDPRYAQNVRFRSLKTGKQDKPTRIRSRFPLLKQGFYYLNEMETKPLASEWLEYPYGARVDCVDAIAYDDCIPRPESPYELKQRRYSEWRRGEGADELTGYGPAVGRDE